MNPITFIGAGGAGINILHDISKKDVPSVKKRYYALDTSLANVNKTEIEGCEFFKVETVKATEDTVQGSGGNRAANVDSIKENILKFIDTVLPPKIKTGLIVLSTSLSGASGSIITPLLWRELVARDYTVVVFAVGDEKDHVSILNTTKSLQTLAGMSKMADKPMTVKYITNHDSKGNRREELVNSTFVNISTLLSIMVSGTNQDLDVSDINSFVDPTLLGIDAIPSKGINFMFTYNKTVPEDTMLLSRTITTTEVAVTDFATHHDKTGIVLDPLLKALIQDEALVTLAVTTNLLEGILDDLNIKLKPLAEKLDKIGCDSVDFDTEDGLVL
jgi:hypothetical protein